MTASSLSHGMKLLDRKLADGNDETGLEQLQFPLSSNRSNWRSHPARETRSPPMARFTGKASTDGGHVDARAKGFFRQHPHVPENQRNSFLPAVHAKGRPRTGSLSPGAWPTRITRLRTGPPLTTGRFISGQRRQRRSAATCRSNRDWRSASLTGRSGRGGGGNHLEQALEIIRRRGIQRVCAVSGLRDDEADPVDGRPVVGKCFRHPLRKKRWGLPRPPGARRAGP